jgi:hypothetical protein
MFVSACFALPAPAAAYSTQLVDPVGDSGSAPDLTGLTIVYSGADADALSLVVTQAGAELPEGSDVVIGFDTDRNPATGGDGGAEYLLTLTPAPGGFSPAFARWQSTQYVAFQPKLPVVTTSKDGGEFVGLCLCDLKDPASFGVFVRSEGNGATDLLPAAGTSDVALPVLSGIRYEVSQPVAGQTFQVLVKGVRLLEDPARLVAPQSATCSATLAGHPLTLTRRCFWRLPATARGLKLTLSVTVAYEGTKTTFNHLFAVR